MTTMEIARKVLEELTAFSFDALSDLFDDDVVFDAPRMPGGRVTINGRAKLMAVIRKAETDLKFWNFSVYEAHDCPERNVAILCATGFAELANGRGFYENRYFLIFECRNGKVILWREYMDTDASASFQARLAGGKPP